MPTSRSAPTVNPSPSRDRHAYVGKKKYKLVAKKVKPIGATLPEEFRIIRNIQGDPLADLPILSPFPINFSPTGRYDQASFDIIEKNHPHGFLTAEEQKAHRRDMSSPTALTRHILTTPASVASYGNISKT
jgi:hypothetical protein